MNSSPKKEIYQITGDAPDPASTSLRGVSSGFNFVNTATAHPVVLYRDRLLTLDVYSLPDQPLKVMLYCPRCEARRKPGAPMVQSLTISQENKAIHFDPNTLPRIPGFTHGELAKYLGLSSIDGLRGQISVEAFRCTWEEEPDLKRGFGFSVCGWHVVIENNIARDV